MKKLLLILSTLILLSSFALANPWYCKQLGVIAAKKGAVTCGEASDSTIIGQSDGSAGSSAKSTDDILCSKTPVHYSNCTVDEIIVDMAADFDPGEYVKAGIYEDDGASSAMLGSESNALEGDNAASLKTITFGTAVTITGTHVWICFHCSSGMSFDYASGLSSGDYATKTISGNDYDTGMPASLDLSGGTDQYGIDAIGRNP